MVEGPFTPSAKFKYEVIISKVITPTLKNIEKGGTDKAEFANTWSQLVITTYLFNQVIILKGLCFRNEETANLSADRTMLARELGNVTEGNKFIFEYLFKALADLIEMDDIDLTQAIKVIFYGRSSHANNLN